MNFFCDNDELKATLLLALEGVSSSLIGVICEYRSNQVCLFNCDGCMPSVCLCSLIFANSLSHVVFHFRLDIGTLFATEFNASYLLPKTTMQRVLLTSSEKESCSIGENLYVLFPATNTFARFHLATGKRRCLASFYPSREIMRLVACDSGVVAITRDAILKYNLKWNEWTLCKFKPPWFPLVVAVGYKNAVYFAYRDVMLYFDFTRDDNELEVVWQSQDLTTNAMLPAGTRVVVRDGVFYCLSEDWIERFAVAERKWQSPIKHGIEPMVIWKGNFCVF